MLSDFALMEKSELTVIATQVDYKKFSQGFLFNPDYPVEYPSVQSTSWVFGPSFVGWGFVTQVDSEFGSYRLFFCGESARQKFWNRRKNCLEERFFFVNTRYLNYFFKIKRLGMVTGTRIGKRVSEFCQELSDRATWNPDNDDGNG